MPRNNAKRARGAALWGGRFSGEADPLFRRFNDSLPFDYRLARHDIRGSIAWARALSRAGVLSNRECSRLVRALERLEAAVERDPELPRRSAEEDVHSFVETALVRELGPLGKKLHTGRSRNDQVATDLRLYARDEIDHRLGELRDVRLALVNLAERERDTLFPGYTHLQRAQPILFAHWCLAYFEMLGRDGERFDQARARVNTCPLGSAALAGTTYPIDREALAAELGFAAPSTNSLDATADRDFIAEVIAAAAICAAHLSRFAEDLVLYSSQEFALVELDESVSSGSSLMPQKKNPDAAELIRGKFGRVCGNLVAILTTMKGLPLAYNKDLQEDKEPLFDSFEHLSLGLRVAERVATTLKVNRDAAAKAATGGYSNATELADYLVEQGVPFRDAHDAVGKIVRHALERGVPLEDLTLAEIRRFAPKAGADVFKCLTPQAGLSRRNVFGGTGPRAVARALAAAKRSLR